MKDNFFQIHSGDNVAVNLLNGHKEAIKDIKKDAEIIKYGYPIGLAATDIKAGEHVHSHNIKSLLEGKSGYLPYKPFENKPLEPKKGTFMGYKRKNGKAGIRNDIYIIPTVGCVNGICERLASLSGAIALTHPYGCSQLGDDHLKTQEILCGLCLNPNAGGVLVVALGCENNTLESFKEMLAKYGYDLDRIRFMTVQKEQDEIECGKKHIEYLKNTAKKDCREECSLAELVIGLKCGGSDALSGITANPLVGKISDKIISFGGSAIMTEIPEMFGAENVMLSRCNSAEIYNKLVSTLDNFKEYYIAHGERIDENPSPGNKEGGISTLADKSLGCVQKGGTAAVSGVIDYGETLTQKGLTVLNGPGNDIVACTALSAAGASLILFTTGRGTPLGSASPVIKISTNSNLSQTKNNWIDFDAGQVLSGTSMDSAAESLFNLIIDVAEGKQTRSEQNNYHEIAIWKNGVTL